MKRFCLLAAFFVLSAAWCSGAPVDEAAVAKADLERLGKVFPSLYWYASTACLRETTRNHLPPLDKHDDFVKENRAVIETFEETSSDGVKTFKSRVRLCDAEDHPHDPDNPEEHWIFEFIYRDNAWQAVSAYKHIGKDRPMDLYRGDIFMGSMKPYIAKGLDAFAHGKDLAAVFPTP